MKDFESVLLKIYDVESPQELVDFIKANKKWFIANGKKHDELFQDNDVDFDSFKIRSSFSDPRISSLIWRNEICSFEPNISGWEGIITFFSTEKTSGHLYKMFIDTPLNIIGGGKNVIDFGCQYSFSLLGSDFKKMAFSEMLSDYKNTGAMNIDRIRDVMSTAKEYINWDSELFLNMINAGSAQSEVFAVEVFKERMEDSVMKTDKEIKKIKI